MEKLGLEDFYQIPRPPEDQGVSDASKGKADVEALRSSGVIVRLARRVFSFGNSNVVEREPQLLYPAGASVDGAAGLEADLGLSDGSYDTVLNCLDLSYAIAKRYTELEGTEGFKKQDKRAKELTAKITDAGWSEPKVLMGKTGRDNCDDDPTCILIANFDEKLIIGAFHGSRNGAYNPFMHDGHGDWGANYDDVAVSAKELGVCGAPDGVMVHRGFGKNHMSIQDGLIAEVKDMLALMGGSGTVVLAGHSKGSAQAALASPSLQTALDDDPAVKAQVKALMLSEPPAYNDEGAEWFMEKIGNRAIRINVHGDPVTVIGKRKSRYVAVGILCLDSVSRVASRLIESGSKESLGPSDYAAALHYGVFDGPRARFGIRAVPGRQDLVKLMIAGARYKHGKSKVDHA